MTEKEYNQCVNEYADNVYRFIIKNLRHEEDARDVVQSAFEKMWMNRAEVDNARCKSLSIYSCLSPDDRSYQENKKNQFKGRIQRRIHECMINQEHNTKKILEEALNRLNETQRSLVLLKDYEGYSYEEIGKITGLNESQVKVYLHRARIQLKNYLVSPENVI